MSFASPSQSVTGISLHPSTPASKNSLPLRLDSLYGPPVQAWELAALIEGRDRCIDVTNDTIRRGTRLDSSAFQDPDTSIVWGADGHISGGQHGVPCEWKCAFVAAGSVRIHNVSIEAGSHMRIPVEVPGNGVEFHECTFRANSFNSPGQQTDPIVLVTGKAVRFVKCRFFSNDRCILNSTGDVEFIQCHVMPVNELTKSGTQHTQKPVPSPDSRDRLHQSSSALLQQNLLGLSSTDHSESYAILSKSANGRQLLASSASHLRNQDAVPLISICGGEFHMTDVRVVRSIQDMLCLEVCDAVCVLRRSVFDAAIMSPERRELGYRFGASELTPCIFVGGSKKWSSVSVQDCDITSVEGTGLVCSGPAARVTIDGGSFRSPGSCVVTCNHGTTTIIRRCKLTCSSSQGNILASEGAEVQLFDCDFTGQSAAIRAEGHGTIIRATASKAAIHYAFPVTTFCESPMDKLAVSTSSATSDSATSVIHSCGGAVVELDSMSFAMIDPQAPSSSHLSTCLTVTGHSSFLRATSITINGFASAMCTLQGACMSVSECSIEGASASACVVSGRGTKATLVRCTVSSSAGVAIRDGAAADVRECVFLASNKAATGHGNKVAICADGRSASVIVNRVMCSGWRLPVMIKAGALVDVSESTIKKPSAEGESCGERNCFQQFQKVVRGLVICDVLALCDGKGSLVNLDNVDFDDINVETAVRCSNGGEKSINGCRKDSNSNAYSLVDVICQTDSSWLYERECGQTQMGIPVDGQSCSKEIGLPAKESRYAKTTVENSSNHDHPTSHVAQTVQRQDPDGPGELEENDSDNQIDNTSIVVEVPCMVDSKSSASLTTARKQDTSQVDLNDEIVDPELSARNIHPIRPCEDSTVQMPNGNKYHEAASSSNEYVSKTQPENSGVQAPAQMQSQSIMRKRYSAAFRSRKGSTSTVAQENSTNSIAAMAARSSAKEFQNANANHMEQTLGSSSHHVTVAAVTPSRGMKGITQDARVSETKSAHGNFGVPRTADTELSKPGVRVIAESETSKFIPSVLSEVNHVSADHSSSEYNEHTQFIPADLQGEEVLC